MDGQTHFINNEWREGEGPPFASQDPASGKDIWKGRVATQAETDAACRAARAASESWGVASSDERTASLKAFQRVLEKHAESVALTISRDTGKPLWESRSEVAAMGAKVEFSIQAFHERRRPVCTETAGARHATRFKPHGVVAVLGPFNLPGHLPNAHIVPALLAGNTVVFKPSELTPRVAEEITAMWHAADLPPGVFNMIQGNGAVGKQLIKHPELDGIFFTGGYETGRAIHRAMVDHPEKILAMEMGGNNPLAVYHVTDVNAASYWTIQSAFITAGQRCTCARRCIIEDSEQGAAFLERLVAMVRNLRVGPATSDPEPFMGPVISGASAQRLLAAQEELERMGGKPLITMTSPNGPGSFLTPGVIDVTDLGTRPDVELFGPLLQVVRVPDFDALIAEANRTTYGLSAGLFTDDPDLYEQFSRRVRAGIVNWNRPVTGASGALPFGGIGHSGNHRPSGYFAADYCSHPVASIEMTELKLPEELTPGVPL